MPVLLRLPPTHSCKSHDGKGAIDQPGIHANFWIPFFSGLQKNIDISNWFWNLPIRNCCKMKVQFQISTVNFVCFQNQSYLPFVAACFCATHLSQCKHSPDRKSQWIARSLQNLPVFVICEYLQNSVELSVFIVTVALTCFFSCTKIH